MSVDTLPPAPPAAPPRALAPRPDRRRAWIAHPAAIGLFLLVLTAASVLLRIRQIGFYYWIDEGIAVGIASHPLAMLPHLLREDGSPPLYYLLLHGWMRLFGRGPAATHALSLVFATIAVPVSYWAGTRLFDRRTGICCAVITAGMPYLTQYAQETRMYSLMLLLSLVFAATFTLAFVDRRRRWLPVVSASLAAALYTHNWALFLGLVSFGIYLVLLWRAGQDRRQLLIDGAIAYGLAAVAFAPWVPTLLYQTAHTGAPWALPTHLWSLTQGLYALVGGRGAAVALLFGGAGGAVAVWRARDGVRTARSAPTTRTARTARTAKALLVLAGLGLGAMLVAWLYARVTPSWATRYLAAVAGPLILAAGLCVARSGRTGVAALALVCCFWVLDPLSPTPDAKSNVASAAHRVSRYVNASTIVLSTQPEQVPVLHYYLPAVRQFVTPLGRVSDPGVVDWRNALERFDRTSIGRVLAPVIAGLAPGQRVALVVPLRQSTSPRWLALIARSSRRWTRWLRSDRSLSLTADAAPAGSLSGNPVRIEVFTRRATP